MYNSKCIAYSTSASVV